MTSTAACLADAVHRVMGVEAQERFKLTSGAVTWLQRHPARIRELSAFRDAGSITRRERGLISLYNT